MNHSQNNQLVLTLLKMGSALLYSGAEILRVEDTLNRIGFAYGAVNMHVFAITSSIVITAEFGGEEAITHSRRIRSTVNTDFSKMEELNELSRDICQKPVSPAEFAVRLNEIISRQENRLKSLAGYILAAGAYAVFFGGSIWDGMAASVIGALIWAAGGILKPLCMNDTVYQFSAAFLSGLVICLLTKLIPALNMEHIMIGDIMLLIPGIMFTNAVRDILLGDTISGAMRLIEALLMTFMLAFGLIGAIWLVGRFL